MDALRQRQAVDVKDFNYTKSDETIHCDIDDPVTLTQVA